MRPGSPDYRRRERARLVRFAAGSRVDAGFGYLDDDGIVDPAAPVQLYLTCRMTHVFALALLAGEDPAPGGPDADDLRALAAHGVAALLDGPLHDQDHGGWFTAIPGDESKQAYSHAFVILAASTAATAGIPGADRLLQRALAVHLERFWDEREGMVVEEWDRAWTRLDPYRGLNSTMHTVEAYLAAGAATGDAAWFDRAERMARRVIGWGEANDWRLPEHFDADWTPLPDFNRDHPADPFRPYGATVGHALEWSRLLLTVYLARGSQLTALHDAAVALADRAVRDGWAPDGADGFVYTTDWDGTPVVRNRLHWVLTEAIATSTVLHEATGEARYAQDTERWWAYADRYLIDPSGQSWRHELGPDNRPGSGTWTGRPDAYHAYQAALMAETVGAPSFAAGVARWRR